MRLFIRLHEHLQYLHGVWVVTDDMTIEEARELIESALKRENLVQDFERGSHRYFIQKCEECGSIERHQCDCSYDFMNIYSSYLICG